MPEQSTQQKPKKIIVVPLRSDSFVARNFEKSFKRVLKANKQWEKMFGCQSAKNQKGM